MSVDNRSFNLVTGPWIKVLDRNTNLEKTVSLLELFDNAQQYRQLTGDMRSQDLAVLRLLLAILTTVYSRFDASGDMYDWLVVKELATNRLGVNQELFDEDDIEDDLLETWQDLYQSGKFSEIVGAYLKEYQARFDFFGDRPFYQVTSQNYDALVPEGKRIATGKGQVAVKQLNRRISESGNKPAIFAPKSGRFKNEMALDELVRWVVTYQNFTGVTDKTKILTDEKFSNSGGWLYRISPVFVEGKSLFETLMLNLVLVDAGNDATNYAVQKPVWEYASIQEYIDERKKMEVPDNLAELYTTWTRLLHIEWDNNDDPTIFSAGVPMFEADNAFIEPMTTWRFDKKTNNYRPALKSLRSLGISMWRNFGQYVKVNQADDIHEPGIVVWLRLLKDKEKIAYGKPLLLNSVGLIGDGNATSQLPAFEFADDMRMQADVLFDPEIQENWPTRIEDVISTTQAIGTDYYHFVSDIGKIRNVEVRQFAGKMSAKFYDRLNEPFKAWLQDLTGHDDREAKIKLWKQELSRILMMAVDEVMQSSSSRDITGIPDKKGILNIFTARNHLMYNVRTHLDR